MTMVLHPTTKSGGGTSRKRKPPTDGPDPAPNGPAAPEGAAPAAAPEPVTPEPVATEPAT